MTPESPPAPEFDRSTLPPEPAPEPTLDLSRWEGHEDGWISASREGCTCGGGLDTYGHEPYCGQEAVVQVKTETDAKSLAIAHNLLVAEVKRLKQALMGGGEL